MRLAVTVWNKRIAPVFDCACTALVLEVSDGEIADEAAVSLKPSGIDERAEFLRAAGVDELICGAVSREAQRALRDRRIVVHPFISGDVSAVVAARLRGDLRDESFSMPGCACARRRRGMRRGRCGGISYESPQR
jgi:predicted Fe-Mo cluster-binding NifX family protein